MRQSNVPSADKCSQSLARRQCKVRHRNRPRSKEFRVDSDASWLRVLAYPDGPLRRFGHHHVISHLGISGIVVIAPNPLESTIMLELDRCGP